MIFSTIIRDTYRNDERRALASALRAICSPAGDSTFASQVIYCYWDFETHEALYLGLAVDAATRFEQHNALRSAPAGSNKREEIDRYFAQRDRLGLSVMVTHSNAQIANAAAIASNPALMVEPDEHELLAGYDTEARSALAYLEGKLIAAGRSRHALPWNQVGGSAAGARALTAFTPGILDLLTGLTDSLFIARRTIRELAEDWRAEQREEDLDVCRSYAQLFRGIGRGACDSDVWHYLTAPNEDWPRDTRPMMLDLLYDTGYIASVNGPRHCPQCVLPRPQDP